MVNGNEMAKELKNQVFNGTESHNNNIYPLGNDGNQIEIDHIGKGEFRLICRDHFSQNFVDYYVTEKELKGLIKFINGLLKNE